MSAIDFAEQRALDRIDPLGREWEQTAMICELVYQILRGLSGGKGSPLGRLDFMPPGTLRPDDSDDGAEQADAAMRRQADAIEGGE